MCIEAVHAIFMLSFLLCITQYFHEILILQGEMPVLVKKLTHKSYQITKYYTGNSKKFVLI